MRKTVGGFRFRDLPDWITCSNFYCLSDSGYASIMITEKICPFCVQELQVIKKDYCDQKEFMQKYFDDETKKLYKEKQDITFEVGIKILKSIEDFVRNNNVIAKELFKVIDDGKSRELFDSVQEIIFEALFVYYLKKLGQKVPKEGLKYYFYEEYEKHLYFFDEIKHKKYISIKEKIISICQNNQEDFYRFVKDNFNDKIIENDMSLSSEFCKEILKHYIEQYLMGGKQVHIRKIEVKGLFGHHSYTLDNFENYSIVIGTNGLGKTTIFRVLELLFDNKKKNDFFLFNLPFKNFTVTFNNGTYVELEKVNNGDIKVESKKEAGFNGDISRSFTITKDPESKGKDGNVIGLEEFYKRMKELFPEIYYKEKRFHFVKTKRLTAKEIQGEFRKYFLDNRQTLTALNNEELVKEELLRRFNLWFSSLYYEKDPTKKSCFKEGNELKIKTSNNNILSIDKLSSGEINILTILFEIWFMTKPGAIVLIDEPEISLHIAWQQRLGEIIQEIVENKKGVQVIMATHSPFIAAGNTDLLVEAELIGD